MNDCRATAVSMIVEQRQHTLGCEYERWGIANGFNDNSRPLLSADEMPLEYPDLTAEQKAWLVDFCRRWEASYRVALGRRA